VTYPHSLPNFKACSTFLSLLYVELILLHFRHVRLADLLNLYPALHLKNFQVFVIHFPNVQVSAPYKAVDQL